MTLKNQNFEILFREEYRKILYQAQARFEEIENFKEDMAARQNL